MGSVDQQTHAAEAERMETIRHSLSHVLAAAVERLFPGVKLGIGPAIENGFYYDFDLATPLTDEDLPKIEKEMRRILKEKLPFERETLSLDAARNLFEERDEPFKLELIDDLAAEGETEVSVYRTGDFVDLCRGPHVETTRDLPRKAFRLDRVAGAYWKGDEHNPMLSRVYGLAFADADALAEFVERRKQARERDHRKLARELDLFVISETVGKGLPMLTGKGATIRRVLERFIVDEELKRGYEHVYSPALGRKELYEISGHWEHYQDSMYPLMDVDGEEYVLRPMTCPHHFMMYNSRPRSYRDLPIRYAEISPQYRKERSGELYGLIRVMCFHLADAHIICRPDQLKEEFRRVLDLIQHVMRCLGLADDCWFRASLRDEIKAKYVDNPAGWEQAERELLELVEEMDLNYVVGKGDAAFYGPKLDVQMKNVHGKDETLFTNQIDMALPERFDMHYVDSDGEMKRPWVLHRSSVGCLERTIAFLLEHYAGALPTWLAPVQTRILTISEEVAAFARKVHADMLQAGIRAELDDRNESLGKKIREGRLQRIPYLCIVGPKEAEEGRLTVRNRGTGAQEPLPAAEFVRRLAAEDAARTTVLTAAAVEKS
jgi:threonyl-tRNA synthetase